MIEKSPNLNPTIESLDNADWDFRDIAYQGINNTETVDDEDEAIFAEVTPYIEKIDPRILKKVFDGWKDRRQHYRELMREEEATAELSNAECDAWADLFYLGTVFRDYLDTVLGLKESGRSGFQLLDSKEEEVANMGRAMGWFSSSEHMVNIVGDRFDNKYEFLGAIAHEMWHAHQVQVIEEEYSDKSDAYLAEFRDYIGIEGNPKQNMGQLLEKEAYAFQHLFKYKLSEAMESAPEMKDVLLGESEDEDGIMLSVEDYMRLEGLDWD